MIKLFLGTCVLTFAIATAVLLLLGVQYILHTEPAWADWMLVEDYTIQRVKIDGIEQRAIVIQEDGPKMLSVPVAFAVAFVFGGIIMLAIAGLVAIDVGVTKVFGVITEKQSNA